jgi:hypothetical protein
MRLILNLQIMRRGSLALLRLILGQQVVRLVLSGLVSSFYQGRVTRWPVPSLGPLLAVVLLLLLRF